MLWVDCLACGFVAVNVALGVQLLQSTPADDMTAMRVWVEVLTGAAIVVTGLSANAMLLCGKRAGLLMAVSALACVLVGIIGLTGNTLWRLANPETLDCPPATLAIGFALGVFMRVAYNSLYVLALTQVAKAKPVTSP